MKTTSIWLVTLASSLLLGACAVQVPPPTVVVVPRVHAEQHPAYLHALADLRAARWLIANRPGDARVSGDEDVAIARINETINEIKHAAIDDGKNPDDHPPVDARLDRKGRLHRADELLRQARSDIAREEDNAAIRGLRDRAIEHVDAAIRATDQAIRDAANGI
jgi:hypothetical protein